MHMIYGIGSKMMGIQVSEQAQWIKNNSLTLATYHFTFCGLGLRILFVKKALKSQIDGSTVAVLQYTHDQDDEQAMF